MERHRFVCLLRLSWVKGYVASTEPPIQYHLLCNYKPIKFLSLIIFQFNSSLLKNSTLIDSSWRFTCITSSLKKWRLLFIKECLVSFQIRSDQSLSHVGLFATQWITARQPPCPSPTQEFTQTHVHWVSDAIQPSHPLSSPSPPAPNPSQHQSLFQWVNSSHEVAKVLEFQL